MDCPNGHGPLIAGRRYWVCEECGHRLPVEAAKERVARGGALAPLVSALPSTLSLVLDEYSHEADDYLALHRMCGALEIVARFLTVIALTDVWQRRGSPEDGFPEGLVRQLLQHLERPTLGSWRVLLEAAIAALPGKRRKQCTVPDLPGYVARFAAEFGGTNADPLQKLLPMRNELAHGGRRSDERVQQLLQAHTARFEELMCGLGFLSEAQGVSLVASPAEGPAWLLRGLPPSRPEFDRSRLPEDFRQAGPDRMLLVTPGGVLDLCPLHAHGEVFQVEQDQLVGRGEEAIQLYSRSDEAAGVDYTALGSRASSSRGKPAWEARFAEIFRLEAWRSRFEVESALARYAFSRRMDDLLRLFVGRDQQVNAAAAKIDALDRGILWLAGKPGMGKSAFMAALVRDHFQPRTDVVCLPYFFQASEGDLCRLSAFAEAALLRLAQATGQDVKIEDDPEKRLEQFRAALGDVADGSRKIVFFLDGMDEITGADPKPPDLIFGCRHPGVVWVCAGRDEDNLVQRFSRDQCQWVFDRHSEQPALRVEREEDEGLLPPLKADNVRGFFIEELGHRLPQFFGRDKQQQNGAWSNEYVEEVIRRSDGLPLYLKLLVQDIRQDPSAFAPGSEERLPRGLEEYYDRIVEAMGHDLSATVPAITTLLALAKEPLAPDTLAVLLASDRLIRQGGSKLLADTLRHSSTMLRRAPTSTGSLGYTLYHESFRRHVQVSPRLSSSIAAAREDLCRLAIEWRQCELGSPARDYALRFGPRTLTEARRWDDLATLLTDLEFIEAKCEAGLTYGLVADYNAALASCPGQDDQDPLRSCARPSEPVWLRECVESVLEGAPDVPLDEAAGRVLAQLRHGAPREHAPDLASPIYAPGERTPDERFGPDEGAAATLKAIAAAETVASLSDAGGQSTALRLQRFASWVAAQAHVLAEHPRQTVPAAYNSACDGPVAQAAAGLVWSCGGPWVECALRDPVAPYPSLCIRTMRVKTTVVTGSTTTVGMSVQAGVAVSPGLWDPEVDVWDLATGGRRFQLHTHTGLVCQALVTPAGEHAVLAMKDGTLELWDLGTGRCIWVSGSELGESAGGGYLALLGMTGDGRAVATLGRYLCLWDLQRRRLARSFPVPKGTRHGAITPDLLGGVTCSGGDATGGFELQALDLVTGRCLRTVRVDDGGEVEDVALAAGGGLLVVAHCQRLPGVRWPGYERRLSLLDLVEGVWLRSVEVSGGRLGLAATPDGRAVLVRSGDGRIAVWDMSAGLCARSFEAHLDGIRALAVTPDARVALSAGGGMMGAMDNDLKLWNLLARDRPGRPRPHDGPVNGVDLTPDLQLIASGTPLPKDGAPALAVSDGQSGAFLRGLPGSGRASALVVASQGPLVVAAGHPSNGLQVWHLASGTQWADVGGQKASVETIALSPDDRLVVTGSSGYRGEPSRNSVRIWDLATGTSRDARYPHGDVVTSVAVSPDGRLALSGSKDETVTSWDLDTGARVQEGRPGEDRVNSVVIDPSGRLLIVGWWGGDSSVHGLRGTAEPRCRLEARDSVHRQRLPATTDGRVAVTGGQGILESDSWLRVWDLDTGELLTIYHADASVTSLSRLLPDGRLACGLVDGRVQLLHLHGCPLSPAPWVTAVVLFRFREGPPRALSLPGAYDDAPSVGCPWCGKRSLAPPSVLDAVAAIASQAGLGGDSYPCLHLPLEAWEEPELLSCCPSCQGRLRYTPFAVDNRLRGS